MKKTLLISILTTLISFIISSYIGSKMMPFQDSPNELLEKQNAYIKTYTPLMNILDIIFLFSLIITFISLVIFFKNKDKLNLGNKEAIDFDKP